MSAANDRIRQLLSFGMIEAEREARKGRPVRREEVKPESPKDAVSQALRDGVVLQARK